MLFFLDIKLGGARSVKACQAQRVLKGMNYVVSREIEKEMGIKMGLASTPCATLCAEKLDLTTQRTYTRGKLQLAIHSTDSTQRLT